MFNILKNFYKIFVNIFYLFKWFFSRTLFDKTGYEYEEVIYMMCNV